MDDMGNPDSMDYPVISCSNCGERLYPGMDIQGVDFIHKDKEILCAGCYGDITAVDYLKQRDKKRIDIK